MCPCLHHVLMWHCFINHHSLTGRGARSSLFQQTIFLLLREYEPFLSPSASKNTIQIAVKHNHNCFLTILKSFEYCSLKVLPFGVATIVCTTYYWSMRKYLNDLEKTDYTILVLIVDFGAGPLTVHVPFSFKEEQFRNQACSDFISSLADSCLFILFKLLTDLTAIPPKSLNRKTVQ